MMLESPLRNRGLFIKLNLILEIVCIKNQVYCVDNCNFLNISIFGDFRSFSVIIFIIRLLKMLVYSDTISSENVVQFSGIVMLFIKFLKSKESFIQYGFLLIMLLSILCRYLDTLQRWELDAGNYWSWRIIALLILGRPCNFRSWAL